MSTTSPALDRYMLYIGGEEVAPASGSTMLTNNPATGEPWAQIADADAADVDRAVAAASQAFAEGSAWRTLPPSKRGRLLLKLAELIEQNADALAATETRDNGKLYKEMRAQLGVIPDILFYFAGIADKIEGSTIPLDRTSVLNYTVPEPLGVVAVITPWNSPLLLALEAIAPALAAGNTVVVKPSEETSASMLEVARLLDTAGFPPGVINVVTGGRRTGEALVEHPQVAKVCFTGSRGAGEAIGKVASGRLASITLELGGKSPNIVFEDADLDAAEAGLLAGIYAASGQTCIAGSRALLHESVYEEVLDRLSRRAEAIVLGDPMDPDTQMGPAATPAQLGKIDDFVTRARSDGARIVSGGERASVDGLDAGLFYRPTIIADVDNASTVAQEEIFGPVLSVIKFADEDEAVALANASEYGLAAGVWTRDVKRAHRMARRLQAGTIWINLYRAIAVNSPFGGFKNSGVGSINGIEAVKEFMQTKSVWVELGDTIQDPFVLRV